jgi:hypothetical protein
MSTTEQGDAVKKSETENAATDSPDGMGSNTESSATGLTVRSVTTQQTMCSGAAANATASATRARSLPLSDEERKRLFRIARDRGNRFMVSAVDVDFLLDVIVRLSR